MKPGRGPIVVARSMIPSTPGLCSTKRPLPHLFFQKERGSSDFSRAVPNAQGLCVVALTAKVARACQSKRKTLAVVGLGNVGQSAPTALGGAFRRQSFRQAWLAARGGGCACMYVGEWPVAAQGVRVVYIDSLVGPLQTAGICYVGGDVQNCSGQQPQFVRGSVTQFICSGSPLLSVPGSK